MSDSLVIAGKSFNSRLMAGTGRHRSMDEMVGSIAASGAEIITVAIRRLDLGQPQGKEHPGLLRMGQIHHPAQHGRM